MKQIQVTLSRAHKIVERLKSLQSDAATEIKGLIDTQHVQTAPTPSTLAELEKTAEAVKIALDTHRELTATLANVKTVVSTANHERGIHKNLSMLDALNQRIALLKTVLTATKSAGCKVSEVTAVFATGVPQSYNVVTVNPVKDEALRDTVADDLKSAQAKAIQVSDEIAELNAQRVTLELPEQLVDLVTGISN